MTVRLVMALPIGVGPNNESQYGDIIASVSPAQITLLKPVGASDDGEEPPDWLNKVIEERMPGLSPRIEVLKTLPLDPGKYGWNHEKYFSTHFGPIVGPKQKDAKTVILCGTGSSWLSNFMTSLAISSGYEILVSSPEDEMGKRTTKRIDFIKEGLEEYRHLFDYKGITQLPSKTHNLQRNLLVRLLLLGGWQNAHELCGASYLPSSSGISKSMEPLINEDLVEVDREEVVKYRLTPSGLVCAVETRKHHLRTLDSEYHNGQSVNRTGELAGLVMSTRSASPSDHLSSDHSTDDLNRMGGIVYDRLSALICNVSSSTESRRTDVDLESEQPVLFSVVTSRGKEIEPSFLSICGPDWVPGENFRDTLRFLMGLDRSVEWKIDITKITSQERVIVSACSYLLDMEAVYTTRKEGNVPIRKSTITMPGYSLWRMISDYTRGDSLNGDVVNLVRSMNSADDFIDKNRYNTRLEKNVTSTDRVDKNITKHGVFNKYPLPREEAKDSWVLTQDGKGLWYYLKARE